jgi:serine/threonine-protein kinase RsbW
VAELTGEDRVVMLGRRPGDLADRSGDLIDVVFGWADFAKLRRLVWRQCADAGLTGTRLDDFVLAVHEIAANTIVHASTAGRLTLRQAANGLRCMVADAAPTTPGGTASRPVPWPGAKPGPGSGSAGYAEPGQPAGADSGRGLWLAATLADELSITSGPDSTIVSLFMRLG